jgi:peroxiredoxin
VKDPSLSDTRILAVAIDSKTDLQKMLKTIPGNGGKPSDFLFLSDREHRAINRYGILSESNRGLPHPATHVVDKGGIVRWKFFETDYRVQPTNQQIMTALKALR